MVFTRPTLAQPVYQTEFPTSHKSSHAASALDVATHQVTHRVRIEASPTHHRSLLSLAKRFHER